MTNRLRIEPLPLETFTFIKKGHNTSASHRYMLGRSASGNMLVAEASDFGPAFRIERLYNDACDVGIAIRSNRTDVVKTFALIETERRDGELVAWHFADTDNTPLKVTVFND